MKLYVLLKSLQVTQTQSYDLENLTFKINGKDTRFRLK